MNLLFFTPPRILALKGYGHRQWIAGVIIVLLLHLSLFWLFTGPVHTPSKRDNRVWIQLLPQALSFVPRQRDAQPKVILRPLETHPQQRLSIFSAEPGVSPERTVPLVPSDAELAKVNPLDEHVLIAAEKAAYLPEKNRSADVLQQALKAVGEIDRQLRSEHGHEMSTLPSMPLTPLAKGLAAAHAAVKPKWFEAARTELISGPNDPKRIYRVTTAMGKYCLYFPDKGSISSNGNPKSGLADFGQPTASTCPTQF